MIKLISSDFFMCKQQRQKYESMELGLKRTYMFIDTDVLLLIEAKMFGFKKCLDTMTINNNTTHFSCLSPVNYLYLITNLCLNMNPTNPSR